VLFASCFASTLVAAPAFVQADDFYEGKTISIIVGFTAGGGYDTYARILSRFIPNHIPGRPTVVVRNQPGAGSLVALRALSMTQPKDGTVMGIFNPGLVTQSVIQPEQINLDFRKFAWIGIATPDFRICYGYGEKGVSSWDDLMRRKEFVMGGTGKGSGNYVNGATLRLIFNAPVKQVLGFPGSAEKRIAIERGELDGDCGDMSSIPADWLRNKKAHVFVRFTQELGPEVPQSARWIGEFATTQEQKDLLELLNGPDELGRSFLMSGEVPADRVAIIRKAFNETMKDPSLIAESEKLRSPMQPMTAEDAERVIARIMSVSPAVVAKAKEIYE
jgi:tripartite-type tricarboxylate transporter receptor subunit TctC